MNSSCSLHILITRSTTNLYNNTIIMAPIEVNIWEYKTTIPADANMVDKFTLEEKKAFLKKLQADSELVQNLASQELPKQIPTDMSKKVVRETNNNLVIPAVITEHQKAIQAKRPKETNNAWENLWDLCDKMMKDSSKIQYIDDGYGEKGVYFPSLWIMQRIAYLWWGSMKQGDYSHGANHYKQYNVNNAFSGMPAQESRQLIYKETLDTLPGEFTDILKKDMYDKGYRWKTLTDTNKIFTYIAKELWLWFNENSMRDQKVVKAYMYLTWAVTWEWLNTDLDSKKDGDAQWKLDGKPISARAVVLCSVISQRISRNGNVSFDCAVPLLKVIV